MWYVAEYSSNVIAASVGPIIQQSILESYDGNKQFLNINFSKCNEGVLFNYFCFKLLFYLKSFKQIVGIKVLLLKSQERFQTTTPARII